MRLAGKVALITGGSRGMGAAEAELFAKEGAKVCIADLLENEGRKLETEINASGGTAFFMKLDVTREEDWSRAVNAVIHRFGKLDILVNNAGVLRIGTVEQSTVQDWDVLLDVNAKGVFLGTKAVIPAMRQAGGGSIVNVSSVVGLVGCTEATVYSASKGAVRLLTKCIAADYGKEGIRANSVHPGPIDTDMIRFSLEKMPSKEFPEIPLRRIGKPQEVAFGVLYLASDESSYVTGSELVIDGGITAI